MKARPAKAAEAMVLSVLAASRRRRPLAQRGDAGRARLLAVGLEHLPDGLAVPHLLEHPAGEEGGDGGVLVCRRQEEVAQVADGVVLDVVHVAQTSAGRRRAAAGP